MFSLIAMTVSSTIELLTIYSVIMLVLSLIYILLERMYEKS